MPEESTGGGKFAIGPEVAFKYSTGTTEYTESAGGDSHSMDGPEFTGFDTEYSLMMKFMFWAAGSSSECRSGASM